MASERAAERLALARERFAAFVGPLLLLFAIGLGSSPVLAWTSGLLIAGLTLNKLLPVWRRG